MGSPLAPTNLMINISSGWAINYLNCYLYHHSPQADHQVMIFLEGMIILDHILPDESPIYLVFSSYDLLELFAGEK